MTIKDVRIRLALALNGYEPEHLAAHIVNMNIDDELIENIIFNLIGPAYRMGMRKGGQNELFKSRA